jgi:hypothetical protein
MGTRETGTLGTYSFPRDRFTVWCSETSRSPGPSSTRTAATTRLNDSPCKVTAMPLDEGTRRYGPQSMRSSGDTIDVNENTFERLFQSHGSWHSALAMDGYVADSLEKRLVVTQALTGLLESYPRHFFFSSFLFFLCSHCFRSSCSGGGAAVLHLASPGSSSCRCSLSAPASTAIQRSWHENRRVFCP